MKRILIVCAVAGLMVGCGGGQPAETGGSAAEPPKAALIKVEAPEPLEIPEAREVASDTDWEAKAHNKEREILEVLNKFSVVHVIAAEGIELLFLVALGIPLQRRLDIRREAQMQFNVFTSCEMKRFFDKRILRHQR